MGRILAVVITLSRINLFTMSALPPKATPGLRANLVVQLVRGNFCDWRGSFSYILQTLDWRLLTALPPIVLQNSDCICQRGVVCIFAAPDPLSR